MTILHKNSYTFNWIPRAGSTVLRLRAARQSRVRIPATDETRNTSSKLCREAVFTICRAKHTDTDWRAAQTQHRRGAMLVGMDVMPPRVQNLHALTCQFKTSKRIGSIGLSWNEFDRWCWCFVGISCSCEILCHTTSCWHTSKQRPGTFIFPCKTNDFQHINKLYSSHIVHFAPCILYNKLAYCATNWSHLLGSSSSHNSFHQTTQILQILLVNYIITTWFRLTTCSLNVGVAHTNSVAKVFQSLLLTGNNIRLHVFETNLIAFRCQCLHARSASAIAC